MLIKLGTARNVSEDVIFPAIRYVCKENFCEKKSEFFYFHIFFSDSIKVFWPN